MMAENKIKREDTTREKTARKAAWTRPEVLPSPNPEPGYEGWEPVKASDHPEITLVSIENEKFKDNLIIGGLMLCKAPVEMVDERNTYYNDQSKAQMQSVDNSLMRENDPRMPLFNDRRSKVTFGNGT